MADIFLSYATEDLHLYSQLCEGLEKNGFSCWISPRDCGYDKPNAAIILSAINECKMLIVVLSQYSNESRHVSGEVDLAYNARKPLICYRLTQVKPSDEPIFQTIRTGGG